jgi:hypothetical protein
MRLMPTEKSSSTIYRFQNRRRGFEQTARLVAYWEVTLDPVSDNFTPEDTDAGELFSMWVEKVRDEHADGLIPIYWSVQSEPAGVYETMPFQFRKFDEDFLTFFTWPVDVTTNEPLNWIELVVVDKLWRKGRADKGGFIQEVTGWKPSILQPLVYLPSLQQAIHPHLS